MCVYVLCMSIHVFACVLASACVHACVRVHVHVCVYMLCVYVHTHICAIRVCIYTSILSNSAVTNNW